MSRRIKQVWVWVTNISTLVTFLLLIYPQPGSKSASLTEPHSEVEYVNGRASFHEQIIRKNSFVIPHLDLTLFIFTVLSPFQAPESQSFLEESTGSNSQLETLPWVRGRQCAFMPVPSSILNTVLFMKDDH